MVNPQSPSSGKSASSERKSGLISLRASEILFYEGDPGTSLFIVQKGQLRLYRPKGRGFIELAVLRAGEVLGEMAYFADNEQEKKRSCSAQAMIQTEVIEISFQAFGKTLANLNPWFKTIVNTLASRLRKTNAKVKELESNSVSVGFGGGTTGYKFFRTIDVIKILSLVYLSIKGHGKYEDGVTRVFKSTIHFYAIEIFNIQDVKIEEFLNMLESLSLMKTEIGQDRQSDAYIFFDVDSLKSLISFFNYQRTLTNEKKMQISNRCEQFLDRIITQIQSKAFKGNRVEADIGAILNDFKSEGYHVDVGDLEQAREYGFVGEIIVGDKNNLFCSVNFELLKKNYFSIKVMNTINAINEKRLRP